MSVSLPPVVWLTLTLLLTLTTTISVLILTIILVMLTLLPSSKGGGVSSPALPFELSNHQMKGPFPPLCSDQSSAGAVRQTVYRRRPGLPGRRTHHLQQSALQDNVISAPSCQPSVSVWKHFCSGPRSLTLSLIPSKLFPTSSGSWSDFVTWTTLKKHDWLIDWWFWLVGSSAQHYI